MIDSLGLLAAVVAVLAFPGGAFLVAATAAGGGLRHRGFMRAPALAPVLAAATACVAAALAPLPGAPARVLPDDGGAVASLPAVGLLLGVAAGLCGGAGVGALRLLAAAALVLPGAALAAVASTPALPALAALQGGRDGFLRALSAVSAVLAAPLVVHGARAGAGRAAAGGDRDDHSAAAGARGLVVAAVAVCATAVALPGRLQSAPAVLAALVAAAVAAAVVGIGARPRVRVVAAVAAVPVAAVATLLVLLAR